jgi:hypothetical protein
MADRHLQSVSSHASQRLAQRNLSYRDGKAIFIYLGRRDIPEHDLRQSARTRLEGTILVMDAGTGSHLTTAYRNRRHGIKDIKRKLKRSLPPDYHA